MDVRARLSLILSYLIKHFGKRERGCWPQMDIPYFHRTKVGWFTKHWKASISESKFLKENNDKTMITITFWKVKLKKIKRKIILYIVRWKSSQEPINYEFSSIMNMCISHDKQLNTKWHSCEYSHIKTNRLETYITGQCKGFGKLSYCKPGTGY